MYSRHALALLAVSASLLLAACGSGNSGGGTTPTPPGVALVPGTQVPVAATQDPAAATDFVMQVVAKGEANTEDPLVLGDVTLATSEIADPVTIIAA
jgi:hypothetical protein